MVIKNKIILLFFSLLLFFNTGYSIELDKDTQSEFNQIEFIVNNEQFACKNEKL